MFMEEMLRQSRRHTGTILLATRISRTHRLKTTEQLPRARVNEFFYYYLFSSSK
jgi:hypothetical protein